MPRLLLADDHQVVREGVRLLLERHGYDVVAEAADGLDAVQLARVHCPDVAVLDLEMPNLTGIACATEILSDNPHVAIVLLTIHTEAPFVVAALRAGIRGYVIKTQAPAELIQAIAEVQNGGSYLSPKASRVLVDAYLEPGATTADLLTPRQRDVLRMIAEGKVAREIAESLGVNVKSAEQYRSRIMARLDVHDTAGLVRYAIRVGLVDVA
jgi:DNA-binding NarL/FixJ family response regulator